VDTSTLAIRIPLIKTGSLSDDHRIEYVTFFCVAYLSVALYHEVLDKQGKTK
jgi:hypothetical protein